MDLQGLLVLVFPVPTRGERKPMTITDCGVINLGTALICLGIGAGGALIWAFVSSARVDRR